MEAGAQTAAGLVMTSVGWAFTVNEALDELTGHVASVITTIYWLLFIVVEIPVSVNVDVVEPLYIPPLLVALKGPAPTFSYHWYVSPDPVALTEKLTVLPWQELRFEGWDVIKAD